MESLEFRRNKKALKLAASQTKAQLKKVAKEKTIVTYPKGEWKKTFQKNFEKNVKLLGGAPEKKKSTKKASSKKPVEKKNTEKKTTTRKATPKKGGVKKITTKSRTRSKK